VALPIAPRPTTITSAWRAGVTGPPYPPRLRLRETAAIEIQATDYHTAGEPFRIVDLGALEIPGATVRDRREYAARSEEVDQVRKLLCHEPRGHADMYGCFLVPPDDGGAELGVLFWHKDGYSTACGHGTIALGAWAVESGRVAAAADGAREIAIDVPSGRVVASVRISGGAVRNVAFRNVPAYVIARGVPAAGGEVDLAYGGAIYAFARAARWGLRVAPDELPDLIALGRRIKRELDGSELARHPEDERLSGIYGTVLHEEIAPLHQRSVAIFADGEVDRSPTGSATSARTALLADEGALGADVKWRADSIIGTTFSARAIGEVGGGLLTEVEGTAFVTGHHRFVLDARDPLGTGFVLR
jgi:proline racemase